MRNQRLLVLAVSAATLALAPYSPATVLATMLLILGMVVDGLLSSRAQSLQRRGLEVTSP